MNHPTEEKWMDYLYGEMPSPERKSLESHLNECAPCRDKRQEFQGTLQSLDDWRVEAPARHRFATQWQPSLKWAAAAALLVTTAFATGRFTRPEIDLQALQTQISAPLEQKLKLDIQIASDRALDIVREKVHAELAAKVQEIAAKVQIEAELATKQQIEQLAVSLATVRTEDQQRVYASIKTLETQLISDQRRMREDLERVAVYADQSFRQAQRQLVQLASYNQADNGTNTGN